MIKLIRLLAGVSLACIALPATIPDDHQVQQTPPIKLGVTGGNVNDRSTSFCCSGTLGGAVPLFGVNFILSNNHVLARGNSAAIGEDISHPGAIDQGCGTNGVMADLAAFVPIRYTTGVNFVDAAIALPRNPADISPVVLGVGIPDWSAIQRATLGMPVIKAGRTTGVTTGTVAGVNVSVIVNYSVVCGVGTRVALFLNQIRVSTPGFSAGGDSGSVIFENMNDGSIRPTGLLFAGGGNNTFANRFGNVLFFLVLSLLGGGSGGAAQPDRTAPGDDFEGSDPRVGAVSRVKDRYSDYLFSLPEAVGHGVGLKAGTRQPVIELYVKTITPAVRRAVPAYLDGVEVVLHETGEIRAVPKCASCGAKTCEQ
jgi:hypothetical protein